MIREIYFHADQKSAIIILECKDIEEAKEHLFTLPLVSFCRKTPYLSSGGEKFSEVVTTIVSHQPPFYTHYGSTVRRFGLLGKVGNSYPAMDEFVIFGASIL